MKGDQKSKPACKPVTERLWNKNLVTDSVRSMRTVLEVGLVTNFSIENKELSGTRSRKNKINGTLPPKPEEEETSREGSEKKSPEGGLAEKDWTNCRSFSLLYAGELYGHTIRAKKL